MQFAKSLEDIAQSPNQDPDAVQKIVAGIKKFYDDPPPFSDFQMYVT